MKRNEIIALTALAILEYITQSLFTFDHQIAIAPLALAAISAAPGIISTISGATGRKKRERDLMGKIQPYFGQQEDVSKSYQDIFDMLGGEMGKSYLDTTEGMSFSNRIADRSDNQRRQLAGYGGVMGLSDEAVVEGLGGVNENEGMQLSQLVSNADQRRNRLRQERMQALGSREGSLNNLMNTRLGIFNTARNQNQQAMQNSYNGMQGAANGFLSSQIFGQPSRPGQMSGVSSKSPGGVTGGINKPSLPVFNF